MTEHGAKAKAMSESPENRKSRKAAAKARERNMRSRGYIFVRCWLSPEAAAALPEWDQDDADNAGEAIARLLAARVAGDTGKF
jgi:hypothetical protein